MSALYWALMEIALLLRCPYRAVPYTVQREHEWREFERKRVQWQEYARAVKHQ